MCLNTVIMLHKTWLCRDNQMECGSKIRRRPVSQSSPCVETVLAPYDGQTDTWWDDLFCLFQAVLVKSREQVADELSRLQRDNDSLQGKHRLHIELQQQEDFQMPNTVQVREARITSSNSTPASEAGLRIRLQNIVCCQALRVSSERSVTCVASFTYSLIK